MKTKHVGWSAWRLRAILVMGLWPLALGGCPIDTDSVATEATRAALQALGDSLVESLSAYLAGT